MRSPFIVLVTAAAAIAACSCGSSGSPAAPASPPAPAVQFALTGTVFDAVLGATTGVPGAAVEVTVGVNTGRKATTDQAGRYRLDGLGGGSVTLRVTATNFESTSRDFVLAGNQTLDVPLSPTVVTTAGRVVDAASQAGLGGVTIAGGSLTITTDVGGAFAVTGPPGSIASPLALLFSSPKTVARHTSLRVPGKDTVVSLIASSFDLRSFDEMFRTPELNRWTTAPPLRIETRSGEFVELNSHVITTISDGMSDAEYVSMTSDLTAGLFALSGRTFPAFASVTRQDSPAGATVNVLEEGWITVMRVRGMETKIGAIGLGNCLLTSDGAVVGGMVLLDRDYDHNPSGFFQQVRQHELGHAMGYTHVTSRDSVMNPTAGPRAAINDADRLQAIVAFQRPPGNRTPDTDPLDFTTNALSFRVIQKGPQRVRR